MFARLYNDEKLGQVLVTKETVPHPEVEGQTCPAIKIQLTAEGLRFGIDLPFAPNEDGFASRDAVFEEFDKDRAVQAAEEILEGIIAQAAKGKADEESNGTAD